MTEDTTLEEFADGSESVDTARSTYAFGEYTCSGCSSQVSRVWRDDGDLVCPDCKTW